MPNSSKLYQHFTISFTKLFNTSKKTLQTLHTTLHNFTKLYNTSAQFDKTIQGYTKQYNALHIFPKTSKIHNYIKLYKIVQHSTQIYNTKLYKTLTNQFYNNLTILYTALQYFTQLYKTLHSFTAHDKTFLTKNYTHIGKSLHNSTKLFNTCQNSTQLFKTLHNFTQVYKT